MGTRGPPPESLTITDSSPFQNRFRPERRLLELSSELYDPVEAARFPAHILRWRDALAAKQIGLHTLDSERWTEHFGVLRPFDGSLPEPLALRYHGHQFRHYNPQLGDGRGFVLAQCRDRQGRLMDLGTKGSGTTPWSRGGDGRLTLQGGVRELLAAELLRARGVPTCRILSLVETGEALQRFDEPSPTRSCVMVRLSHGHWRIGTAQRLSTLDLLPELRALVAHHATHYYPELAADPDDPELPLRWFTAVLTRCADLAAAWMSAGFVHGVLNTDNLNLSGESFDYGPWRFMPQLDPGLTAAYFDNAGLYSFARQPGAVLWGLERLAGCVTNLRGRSGVKEILGQFPALYRRALRQRVAWRLGVTPQLERADLVAEISSFLLGNSLCVDDFYHDWYGGLRAAQAAMEGPRGRLYAQARFAPLRAVLETYEPVAEGSLLLQAPDPVHLQHPRVEALWQPIADEDNWGPLYEALKEIRAYGDRLSAVAPAPRLCTTPGSV